MQVMISAFQPHGEVSGHNFSDIRQISKGQKVKQNWYIYSTICDGLDVIRFSINKYKSSYQLKKLI
jgi:hypothetical protein